MTTIFNGEKLTRFEFERLRAKFPFRIPVIVFIDGHEMKKCKFITPNELKLCEFTSIVRTHIISLKKEDAIFVFVDNSICKQSSTISQLHDAHADKISGFLLLNISVENTFGCEK